MMLTRPDDVLAFWLDEVGPKRWYGGGAELDARIRERFEPAWQAASEGALSLWLTYPSGTLAYVIVTDQFPRNMFRDTAAAFATDPVARAAAKAAISKGWDMRIAEPARHFFYMPLMHSESLVDQERCVRLMYTRMPESGADYLVHAKAHREVIRRFGRFPTRNTVLARCNQAGESSYLDEGGYGNALRQVQA